MFWDYKYVLNKFLKVRLFDYTVIVRFVSFDMCIINQAKTTLAIIYDSVFSRLIAFDVNVNLYIELKALRKISLRDISTDSPLFSIRPHLLDHLSHHIPERKNNQQILRCIWVS